MDLVARSPESKPNAERPETAPVNAAVTAVSIVNFQTWSNHALSVTNSLAATLALIAAVVLLLSLGFLYFSGREMSARVRIAAATKTAPPVGNGARPQTDRPNGSADEKVAENERKVARLTQELTDARLSVDARRADLVKLKRELAEAQKADEAKTDRVAKLENDFATVKKSEEEKSSRVTQLEEQLGQMRKSDAERTSRLTQMEKDLETARKTSTQKPAATPAPVAAADTSRTLTEAQRAQFLQAVRGNGGGKVIVSAFFENKQTHDFGRSVIALLKNAGFDVVEQAPVNFFTTSRPSSGVRIGCEDMSHPPAHFITIRKGFEAMGIEIPDASVVNAEEKDVVEIQITPKE